MRDEFEERRLLADFETLLHQYPSAGAIAGIVAVEGSGKVLRSEVNTVGFSGLHCLALAATLLQRASEELCATGPARLVRKIETAVAVLDLATVDIRVQH